MPIDYSIPAKFGQLGISQSTLASLREQTARQESLRSEQAKQATACIAAAERDPARTAALTNQSLPRWRPLTLMLPSVSGSCATCSSRNSAKVLCRRPSCPRLTIKGILLPASSTPVGRVEDYRLPPEPAGPSAVYLPQGRV